MNILLLNHHAGSPRHGMELRPYHLAREWVRQGHRVLVVAASFSHARTRQPVIGWRVKREMIDGIDYRWMPTPAYRGNGVRRGLNIAAFLAGVGRDAGRLARRFEPDAVIASSTYPLDVWVAGRIARLAGARLVYEVHEPWPLAPVERGVLAPTHPFVRACQRAEDHALLHADAVVSMLPKVDDHFAAHGLDPGRLRVVPNGIAIDDRGDPPPLDNAALADHLAKLRAARRLVVGYLGPHGSANALDDVLDAAAELRHEPMSIVLVGDGPERPRLLERLRAEGLTHVAMFPPVPAAQAPTLRAAFDIACVAWRRSSLHRFGLAPQTLLEAMWSGRPVVHAVEAGHDPVAEAGCGLSVRPESGAALAAGIRTLALCSAEQRAALGSRGRDHIARHHAYPMLARDFLQALQVPPAAEPSPPGVGLPGAAPADGALAEDSTAEDPPARVAHADEARPDDAAPIDPAQAGDERRP